MIARDSGITVICLAWAARALDLPPWTEPHWREVR
jgi:hypothetical protein